MPNEAHLYYWHFSHCLGTSILSKTKSKTILSSLLSSTLSFVSSLAQHWEGDGWVVNPRQDGRDRWDSGEGKGKQTGAKDNQTERG